MSADGQVLTYGDLMTGHYPAPEPLIADHLEAGTVANWSGLWGTGKTWCSTAAARAVASGTDYLGQFPARQGDVLVVDQENTQGGMQARLKAMERAAPLGSDLPITFAFLHGVRLDDLEGFRTLDRIIGQHRPALVVLDSWIRFMAANENNAVAVALVNENIRSLVLAHGCSVVVLDHIRKAPPGGTDDPNSRTRGSGEKIGFVENALTIERSRDDKHLRIVHPLKRRYGPLGDPYAVVFDHDAETGAVSLTCTGDVSTDATGRPGEVLEAIAALKAQLGHEDAADATTVAGWLGWSESTARRHLKRLIDVGLVRTRTVRPQSGKGANRTVYDAGTAE